MGPSPTGLLLLSTWLPDELHDAFSGWCDDHHRELLTVPGFMRARRLAFVEGSAAGDDAQFLTMYETADLAVLSDVWQQFGQMSASGLRNWTHDHCPEWKDPDGSMMPMTPEDLFSALKFTPEQSREALARLRAESTVNSAFASVKG